MSHQLDHRQIAGEMGLFIIDEQVGAGLPLWLPNGVAIRDALENFMKELEFQNGYQRVVSPHIAKSSLYEMSGHLAKFKEDMYPPMKISEAESEFYLRPMNCPHHHQIFASALRSYRQLPLRLAEYGQVYRYENSGSLKGLSRVRGLCQNDAHIYVEPAAAESEIQSVVELHESCYKMLGLVGYRYRLSKHDPKNLSDFDGPKELWLQAEEILRRVLIKKGLPFFEADGEAAFYGPKIDVQMPMISGHEESIASVQLDFMSSKRFGLSYVSKEGKKEEPWIIHRAPLGSHERFIALLIEYFQGQLPGWLAPVQLLILPVSEKEREVAKKLASALKQSGLRAVLDENEGSLSKRIRFAHQLRPFAKVVMGPKEVSEQKCRVQFREDEIFLPFAEVEKELKSRLQG